MIKAEIVDILSHDNIHIVKFNSNGQTLTMMSLELSEKIKIGTKVLLQMKSSHVAIGKDIENLKVSYSNVIKSRIISINRGELLSIIKLQISKDEILESLLTTSSCDRLELKIDDEVVAFIKASEISIAKVL